MIILIVELEFSASDRHRVLAIARNMDLQTESEAGCMFYRHAIDVRNENRLILSERWSDAEALRTHFRSAHFRAFRAEVEELGMRLSVAQFSGTETSTAESDYWKMLL